MGGLHTTPTTGLDQSHHLPRTDQCLESCLLWPFQEFWPPVIEEFLPQKLHSSEPGPDYSVPRHPGLAAQKQEEAGRSEQRRPKR